MRVSTYGSYQTALLDLMSAQARGEEANRRVSTQKNATDLVGFGRQSETLTALKSSQARIQGFMDVGQAVSARLDAQDLFMGRLAEGIQGAREEIANALGAGRVETLMSALETQYQSAREGLNGKHQGLYLFAGGRVDQAPLAAADLTALAAAAAPFGNDQIRQTSRIDEGTTIQTGFLASDLGGRGLNVMAQIQRYQQGLPAVIDGQTFTPAGADTIAGKPTADVEAFLKAAMSELDRAFAEVTDQTAINGGMQNQVERSIAAQDNQRVALEELVGSKTDADMAKAITDLQMAQVAIQASAQVISQLKQTSLLDYLR
jgi:flagellar hook-associated protein 3 FlgL